jgi:hypothetical protein
MRAASRTQGTTGHEGHGDRSADVSAQIEMNKLIAGLPTIDPHRNCV